MDKITELLADLPKDDTREASMLRRGLIKDKLKQGVISFDDVKAYNAKDSTIIKFMNTLPAIIFPKLAKIGAIAAITWFALNVKSFSSLI
jgi:hypothetical protein